MFLVLQVLWLQCWLHACAFTIIVGAKAWCFKKLAYTGLKAKAEIEVDGMAVSDSEVLLVERKPAINMDNVKDVINKRKIYE